MTKKNRLHISTFHGIVYAPAAECVVHRCCLSLSNSKAAQTYLTHPLLHSVEFICVCLTTQVNFTKNENICETIEAEFIGAIVCFVYFKQTAIMKNRIFSVECCNFPAAHCHTVRTCMWMLRLQPVSTMKTMKAMNTVNIRTYKVDAATKKYGKIERGIKVAQSHRWKGYHMDFC